MNAITATLQAEIQRHHDEAQRCAGEAVEHARQAGEALLKAKAEIGHGNWLSWFEKSGFTFAERTGQAYMRLAKEWPKLPEQKRNAVADLSLRDAMKAISKPAANKPKAAKPSKPKPQPQPEKVQRRVLDQFPQMDRRAHSDLAIDHIDWIARGRDQAACRELRRIIDRATEKLNAITARAKKAEPKKSAKLVRGKEPGAWVDPDTGELAEFRFAMTGKGPARPI